MDRSFEQDDDDPSNLLPDRVGSLIDSKYLVLKLIGHGSTGAVYVCRHVGLDILVALKILHSEMAHNASFVDRFKLEAQAASRLEHPNSVRVRDFGQDASGALFIAMEYIEGRDLLQVLEEDGPFSAERAVDVMAQILDVLGVAHSVGIVHRDLKPENVLLRQVEVDGVARELVTVCDFGIAQFAPVPVTPRRSTGTASGTIEVSPELDAIEAKVGQAAVVAGTPAYMSPEQARAETQDARSDLYSAGVVLYQLMTLQLPFFDEDAYALARKHCLEEPPPPSQFGAVSPVLEQICLKALAKDKADRFQSAREMRTALLRSLGAEPELGARAATGGAARWRGAFLGTAARAVRSRANLAANGEPSGQAGASSHFTPAGQTPLVATTVAAANDDEKASRRRGVAWRPVVTAVVIMAVAAGVTQLVSVGLMTRRADAATGPQPRPQPRVRVATQQQVQSARTPVASASGDLAGDAAEVSRLQDGASTAAVGSTNGRGTGQSPSPSQFVEESSIVVGAMPPNAPSIPNALSVRAGGTPRVASSGSAPAASTVSTVSSRRAEAEQLRPGSKPENKDSASATVAKAPASAHPTRPEAEAAPSKATKPANVANVATAQASAQAAADTSSDISGVTRLASAALEELATRHEDALEPSPGIPAAPAKTPELIAFNADSSANGTRGSTFAQAYQSHTAPTSPVLTLPARGRGDARDAQDAEDAKDARVTISGVAARSAVSKASVRGTLNMSAITDCYRLSLRAGSAPNAPITAQIALTASMNGGVAAATLDAPALPSSLRECIEHVARRGRFRESDTGEAQASVTLAFVPR